MLAPRTAVAITKSKATPSEARQHSTPTRYALAGPSTNLTSMAEWPRVECPASTARTAKGALRCHSTRAEADAAGFTSADNALNARRQSALLCWRRPIKPLTLRPLDLTPESLELRGLRRRHRTCPRSARSACQASTGQTCWTMWMPVAAVALYALPSPGPGPPLLPTKALAGRVRSGCEPLNVPSGVFTGYWRPVSIQPPATAIPVVDASATMPRQPARG